MMVFKFQVRDEYRSDYDPGRGGFGKKANTQQQGAGVITSPPVAYSKRWADILYRRKDICLAQQRVAHIQYIKIITWLQAFLVIFLHLVGFSLCPSLFWELRDDGVMI